MVSELSDIELGKYLELLRRVLPEPVSVGLSQDGDLVNQIGAALMPMDTAVAWLKKQSVTWWQVDGHFDVGDAALVVFVLRDHHQNPYGALVIQHGVEDLFNTKLVQEIARPVADCVSNEITLNRELNEMSEELTERYEELNLVYDTQDQVGNFEETTQYLKQMVDNCHTYLDVALCALILRDRHIVLYDHSDVIEVADAQVAVEHFQERLYDWVASTREIVVVNDVDKTSDRGAAAACRGLPYKIAASPILNGATHVGGVLIVANLLSDGDFTNNDKNLLDVMARKASKIIQSSFDTLTGMAKRAGFEYQLGLTLASAPGHGAENAVLVMDLDRTEVVNETLGYEIGDQMIKQAANVVEDTVRTDDVVARLGGDQFGVLVRNCSAKAAAGVADKICERIHALEVEARGRRMEASVSIGVYSIRNDDKSAASVVACAEISCASAKDLGGNQAYVYHDGDEDIVRRKSHMDLVGRIQETLRTGRFCLYSQVIDPLQSAPSGPHVESLLRMLDDNGALIAPGMFLPAAERYHLMPAIDRWVIGETFSRLADANVFEHVPDLVVAINLSGQSVADPAFTDFLLGVLDEVDVPAGNICFEITETSAIGDFARAENFMKTIKDRGVLFSLDDFGTGLSSFSYLKQLPVDYLKIDGSFVKDICTDPIAETMVSAINRVGHTMGLLTVGEFVETEEIRDRLRRLGVDYGQGYGIARPEPFENYLKALVDDRVRHAG
ncbi:MAG: EAL domain-containing protein [Gammaproteobacteria bacterium]|nr:EAL domain-containing protein [Gammaproteobacteria bacterium]